MSVTSSPSPRATRPRQTGSAHPTAAYSELLATAKDMGLMRRRRGFYLGLFGVLLLALGGAVTGFVLLGDSWFQLLIAGALGIIFTQFAFLAHEASHRQVFTSGKANDRAGRALATAFVGMSYSWWMSKHTRHHGNPNTVGKDPDIARDTVSFLEEDAAKTRGAMAWLTRRQGYALYPLLLLEGINLHYLSFKTLFGRRPVEGRGLELSFIGLRLAAYLAAVFLVLPLGMAFAFLGVQLAVFGFYMGASFAPNHVGMTVFPAGSRLDFLSKQVLSSRNITGGWAMTTLMGGLDLQVEHHLFPSMPRPALVRVRPMVEEYCATHKIPYTQTSLLEAHKQVVAYLNRVGLAAPDPFDCPMVNQFRTRRA
ncbi:acyl-CoA desaturase [Herbiconiux moechotypicola]|uniref:Acyl-CoA desaturase n=1 Tax=Herbiconiux moechotypicola TaxID=637393 RepID=A0ABN3DMM8_9MICO|nr:acyl-CoA desaturase [Herbiconiux moechotypicola]MCS5730290.1 acyl-CoA desaturase [Herbiconiux moechotypicola]